MLRDGIHRYVGLQTLAALPYGSAISRPRVGVLKSSSQADKMSELFYLS